MKGANLQRRRAFTLVEVLLVIGVIAVFAGMTLPSVFRMVGQQKLNDSAERVRSAIATARFRAIESGIVYQFCCETNGGNYVVVPFELDHLNLNSTSQQVPGTLQGRLAGLMPKGIIFSSAALGVLGVGATAVGSQKISSVYLDGLPNAASLSGLNWSPPILFHPNGTASSDAEITVKDSRSQFIKLRVRAFTGAVSMDRLTVEKR